MLGNKKNGCTRLSVMAFAFALGITNGLGMLLLAVAGLYWGYGVVTIQEVSLLYHGYAATWEGGLYGLGWGFLDGFVFGLVLSLIYNMCLCCCSAKRDK